MTVFWHLLFGHLLADFVFKKRFTGPASPVYYALHGLIYFILLSLSCWKYLTITWFSVGEISFNGVAAIAAAAMIYILAGVFGRRTFSGSGQGLLLFLCRQFLLISMLFIIAPILPFGGNFAHYIYGPDLLFIGNVVLIVSFVFSDFLVYLAMATDKDFGTDGLFDKRFLNMLLRIVLLLLIMVPGWLGIIAAGAILAGSIKSGFFKDDRIYFYIGCTMTVIFAILIRGIFHGIC